MSRPPGGRRQVRMQDSSIPHTGNLAASSYYLVMLKGSFTKNVLSGSNILLTITW